MFINVNSIKMKTPSMNNYISMGQYLTQADFQYPKAFAGDVGRNLAGSFTGTFVGVFPKLVLYFRRLTKDELELITPILDAETQSVQYYDTNKKAITTMNTYSGDYTIVNKRITNGTTKNEPFSCSFITRNKRS